MECIISKSNELQDFYNRYKKTKTVIFFNKKFHGYMQKIIHGKEYKFFCKKYKNKKNNIIIKTY